MRAKTRSEWRWLGARGEQSSVWEHPSGWRVVHSGRPTALRPWSIENKEGARVEIGGKTAFRDLATAQLLAEQDYRVHVLELLEARAKGIGCL